LLKKNIFLVQKNSEMLYNTSKQCYITMLYNTSKQRYITMLYNTSKM
jgi:hypothetical protein